MTPRTIEPVLITFKGPALLCDAFSAMLATAAGGAGIPIARPLTLVLKDCVVGAGDELDLSQPGSCVMVTRGDQAGLLAATRLGVQVFVGVEDEPDVLWEAIRAASSGEAFCSRTLLPKIMRALREAPHGDDICRVEVTHKDSLSEREREIATLVAAGRSNEQVAQRLFISVATVKFHLGNIYRKLGISRRGQIHSAIPHPALTSAAVRPNGTQDSVR